VTQVNGIAVWAEGIKAELAQRLPRQRKTQRDKLAVLVASLCTALGFWDTGLKPTPPERSVEAVVGDIQPG
jgi:hypothetical protein